LNAKEKDLLNPEGVDRRKQNPSQQDKSLDRKNDFRIDFRQRLDLFVKTILVFSGGSLSISINTFFRNTGPVLSPEIKQDLIWALGLLFFTIIAYLFAYFIFVAQGSHVNKLWKAKLPLGDDQIEGNRFIDVSRLVIRYLIIIGFFTFLVGFAFLGIASIDILLTKS